MKGDKVRVKGDHGYALPTNIGVITRETLGAYILIDGLDYNLYFYAGEYERISDLYLSKVHKRTFNIVRTYGNTLSLNIEADTVEEAIEIFNDTPESDLTESYIGSITSMDDVENSEEEL